MFEFYAQYSEVIPTTVPFINASLSCFPILKTQRSSTNTWSVLLSLIRSAYTLWDAGTGGGKATWAAHVHISPLEEKNHLLLYTPCSQLGQGYSNL